jgi:threonine/homoserine/homoserine lactone efflux protein
MPISAVLGFWSVAALLIVVPGPDWTFSIGAGLRARALPAAAGLALGYLGVTAVVAAGVGALMAASPVALTVVAVVGGAYLVWTGIGAVRHPATPGSGPAGGTFAGVLGQGAGVSALNPKGLLTLVAVLPQFAGGTATWPVAAQLALLGVVFTLTSAGVSLAVGMSAQRVLAARPGSARAVSRGAGVCMILVGAALMIERLLA